MKGDKSIRGRKLLPDYLKIVKGTLEPSRVNKNQQSFVKNEIQKG